MKRQFGIGQRFGSLTVVEYSYTGKHWRRYFKCHCDCGNEATVMLQALTSGNTKSCGCLRGEATKRRYGLKPGQAAMRQVVLGYKRHCRESGRPWDLTEDQFEEISQRDCWYCGTSPRQVKKSPHGSGDYVYNGIDRVDSSRGYEANNVVSCCIVCNKAKSDTPVGEFRDWVVRVAAMAEQWGG